MCHSQSKNAGIFTAFPHPPIKTDADSRNVLLFKTSYSELGKQGREWAGEKGGAQTRGDKPVPEGHRQARGPIFPAFCKPEKRNPFFRNYFLFYIPMLLFVYLVLF